MNNFKEDLQKHIDEQYISTKDLNAKLIYGMTITELLGLLGIGIVNNNFEETKHYLRADIVIDKKHFARGIVDLGIKAHNFLEAKRK